MVKHLLLPITFGFLIEDAFNLMLGLLLVGAFYSKVKPLDLLEGLLRHLKCVGKIFQNIKVKSGSFILALTLTIWH